MGLLRNNHYLGNTLVYTLSVKRRLHITEFKNLKKECVWMKLVRGIWVLVLAVALAVPAAAYSQKDFAGYVQRAKQREFVLNDFHEQIKTKFVIRNRITKDDYPDEPLGEFESYLWQISERGQKVSIININIPLNLIAETWSSVFLLNNPSRNEAVEYLEISARNQSIEVERGDGETGSIGDSRLPRIHWSVRLDPKQLPPFVSVDNRANLSLPIPLPFSITGKDRDRAAGIFFNTISNWMGRFWVVTSEDLD
jgi:hypothetical protein